ncbi:cupredoxin domain-containing protein [Cohnella cholangitidis]|uniref:Cytochrome C oxidase subunit II n=1 Tax=Cohnella cholangitidis TaxID=2598458 RepID=A0A7G5C2M8_9BACL|nr:cupredoxin domain-containing protein [Cohnella cholangitidis]QMV43462.1 cytochrome C oxidase subunit II [Cohnella cholangitidis]
MQRKIAYFLTLTALVLALSACGGNNKNTNEESAPSPAESASTEVVIKASSWEFDQKEYALPKDTPVKLTVENLSGAHGIEIIGQDIKIRGNKSEVVTLPAGTYEFKCNIMCGNGHGQMVAKLVVS